MAHISVVVPVYRAGDCLEELYRRLKAALEPITHNFEIVLVEARCNGITAGLDHCDSDW